MLQTAFFWKTYLHGYIPGVLPYNQATKSIFVMPNILQKSYQAGHMYTTFNTIFVKPLMTAAFTEKYAWVRG